MKQLKIQCHSEFDNIYYCCTQKTASQWIRAIFSDSLFYAFSGLKVVPYRQLGLKYARIEQPFPLRSIATHLYVDYPTFKLIPKPGRYRTFFVLRDPRDIVVSWYFSARYSHKPVDPIPQLRRELECRDQNEGMRYMIDRLVEWGSFDAQRSWVERQDNEPVSLFRFEHLATNSLSFIQELFACLEVPMPEALVERLVQAHAFHRYSAGRQQGIQDRQSHFRKGVVGDYANHFDDDTSAYFHQSTGDLVERLGYGG